MAGLTQRNGGPMRKANSFSHIGHHAINILARLEARKAAKEQFRQQGIKYYRHVELLRQASEYLAAHPELYEVALGRAWQMGMDRKRINEMIGGFGASHAYLFMKQI